MDAPRKIRVAQFTPHLYSGGIEERMSRILGGLDREKFDLTWMGFGESNAALVARAGRWVDVVHFNKEPSILKVNLSLLAQIVEEVRGKQLDIVQVHNWSVGLYGILGARLGGARKVIFEAAGRDSPEGPSQRQLALMHALGPLVDRFTSVCDFLTAEMSEHWGAPRERTLTMPTGVDLARTDAVSRAEQRARFGFKDDDLVIGTICMLRPVKRIEDLIEAGAILAREDPRIKIVAIGNAYRTDPAALKAQAAALGIGDRFFLPGRVEDSYAAVHAIDVFVNCSTFEGASNAIIEAMAASVPVVATAVGGSVELVVEGETGFLVPPLQPDRLAEAIRKLTCNPSLRAAFGRRAKEIANERHSETGMIAAYADLFEALAAEQDDTAGKRALETSRGILSGLGLGLRALAP